MHACQISGLRGKGLAGHKGKIQTCNLTTCDLSLCWYKWLPLRTTLALCLLIKQTRRLAAACPYMVTVDSCPYMVTVDTVTEDIVKEVLKNIFFQKGGDGIAL